MGETEEVSNCGKWEDEEERRFYEELVDLKDFIPTSILNVDGTSTGSKGSKIASDPNDLERREACRKEHEDSEIRRLENEIENIKLEGAEDDVRLLDKEKDEQDAEYARLLFGSSFSHISISESLRCPSLPLMLPTILRLSPQLQVHPHFSLLSWRVCQMRQTAP